MKNRTIKKGEVLQVAGERDHKAYRVVSGLLRSYSLDENGKEHIFLFAPEGWIIADAVDLDEPSELYIDALEDSEVLVMEKDIEISKPEIRPLVRRISVLQKRVILLMSATAMQRYEHFLETYPKIVQRVPQKMIASYLGITPEALSKLKGIRSRKD